ncbi:hypothetical protein CCHR01_15067 [Colletotrichum chrysophilum]|uniref:Uncharacterized protein n=1 Tax=Colletotrichum chrysophilum TaxID=1836956 RepID=A0AAD9A8B7_9PEZI|nr:hypothetical protein CCHR01_15067 [Colletotrichum chrysophilum]
MRRVLETPSAENRAGQSHPRTYRPRAGEAPVGWMHHAVEDEPRCMGISTDVKKAKIKQLTGRYPSKKSEKSRHASRQRAGLAGAGQGRASSVCERAFLLCS